VAGAAESRQCRRLIETVLPFLDAACVQLDRKGQAPQASGSARVVAAPNKPSKTLLSRCRIECESVCAMKSSVARRNGFTGLSNREPPYYSFFVFMRLGASVLAVSIVLRTGWFLVYPCLRVASVTDPRAALTSSL
jgi:hypothetical protein